MRRVLTALALVLAVAVLAVAGTGAGGDGDGYRVRAIFDNAAAIVPGEDVKVAGAKVGVIDTMDVTEAKQAAITLKIEDERFTPFRADAECTVRPQSLIGEKFVECDIGSAGRPELAEIEEGPGAGEHLLPVVRTHSPVDLDLVNNVLRRPFRERLAILISELGTGVAGRGEDLNEVIHRANPALRETDRVLAILGRQNRTLATLARDSDTVLAPLAREKRRVAGFVEQANTTASATAERRADIERTVARLPRFLAELRPLMADLGGFADDATPVVRDVRAAAPDLSRVIADLEPFSRAALPALRSLGRATVTGRPALVRTRPLVRDLGRFATDARPVSTNLARLARSLDETGGIERLMDFIFYGALAVNGFDDIGHYLRAALVVNLCSSYSIEPASGCRANFSVTRSVGSATRRDPALAAAAALLGGRGEIRARETGSPPPLVDLGGDPDAEEQRSQNLERIRRRAREASPALRDNGDPALDYLLGDG